MSRGWEWGEEEVEGWEAEVEGGGLWMVESRGDFSRNVMVSGGGGCGKWLAG